MIIIIAASFYLLSGYRVLAANGYTGYFDESMVYDDSLGSFVIEGGLSTSDKATFISKIIDYHNGTGSSMQRVGADFIIQTMRGGDDHSTPDSGDVENWRALVNDENIAISIGGFNYTITTYIPNQNTSDVTYRNKSWSTPSAMRFYDKRNPGKTLYAIDTHCGNPLGKLPGLNLKTVIVTDPPAPISYNNTGCRPRKLTVSPSMSYDSSGNYSAVPVNVNFYYPGVDNFIGGPYSSITNIDLPHQYSLAEDNMGIKLIEQRDSYSKVTTTVTNLNTGEIISQSISYVLNRTASTITIPVDKCYNYELEASITDNYGWAVDGDIKAGVRPTVINRAAVLDYPNTKSRDTNWQLNKLIYQPGRNINNDKGRGSVVKELDPCSNFIDYNSCQQVSSGSDIFNPGDNLMAALDGKIDDLEVGTKVCFVYSVYTRSSEFTNLYYHSNLLCHIISKKPKTQIHGGDLMTGRSRTSTTPSSSSGDVMTSISIKGDDKKVYGSWVDYALIAKGSVSGMASGAAFVPVTSASSWGGLGGDCYTYSWLTFANNPCAGHYTNSRSMPNLGESFKEGAGYSSGTSLNSLSSGVYKSASSILLGANEISDKWIVLKVSGKVTITGDIKYTSGVVSDINKIPQLIIIADNIDIQKDVKRIDAWLVANSSINTCSNDPDPSSDLTALVCKNTLNVNGPVMANKLYLRRTAGSGVAEKSGDPAEVFSLTPDAYLWAFQRASSQSIIRTVYTTELPPKL